MRRDRGSTKLDKEKITRVYLNRHPLNERSTLNVYCETILHSNFKLQSWTFDVRRSR